MTMRPLLLSLLLCLPLHGQEAAKPPQIEDWGSTPYAALLRVYNAPGWGRNWSVEPPTPGMKLWHAKIDGMGTGMVITGPAGTYVATCRLSRQAKPDEDQADQVLTYTFTLGTEPGPPPPIPPGPPPTPPVDPLAAALRQAAQLDGWPAEKFTALAGAFQSCAAATVAGKTVGEITTAHKKTLSVVPLPGRVADLIVAELRKLDPVLPPLNPSKLPTNGEVTAVRNTLERLATACAGAAR